MRPSPFPRTSCLSLPAFAPAEDGLAPAELFRNQALASYHSTKSGHTNFEESTEELKPLTEEEKAEKLREVRPSCPCFLSSAVAPTCTKTHTVPRPQLRAKMDEKKKLQAKQDAEEARRNEEIRRKSGKDEAQAREALKLKEAERAAMLRKKGAFGPPARSRPVALVLRGASPVEAAQLAVTFPPLTSSLRSTHARREGRRARRPRAHQGADRGRQARPCREGRAREGPPRGPQPGRRRRRDGAACARRARRGGGKRREEGRADVRLGAAPDPRPERAAAGALAAGDEHARRRGRVGQGADGDGERLAHVLVPEVSFARSFSRARFLGEGRADLGAPCSLAHAGKRTATRTSARTSRRSASFLPQSSSCSSARLLLH